MYNSMTEGVYKLQSSLRSSTNAVTHLLLVSHFSCVVDLLSAVKHGTVCEFTPVLPGI